MWLLLAFFSAAFLGLYDVSKKQALKDNAVLPVLFLNTVCASLIFLPMILLSNAQSLPEESMFYVPKAGWDVHKYIIIKSLIVLSSWIFGYFGMKNLPITIVGPIVATRPMMVLLGALLIFGERLNTYQWIGVAIAMFSFYMLSRSGKKEGINFSHNKWIYFVVLASVLGAVSALYDKFLMQRFDNMTVQAWFNIYQCFIMGAVLLILWYPTRKKTTKFHWSWAIPAIALFVSAADFLYFTSLGMEDSMISVVSMVRRGSVVVSFLCGAIIFKEKNLKSKALDLILVFIGMIFFYLGSR